MKEGKRREGRDGFELNERAKEKERSERTSICSGVQISRSTDLTVVGKESEGEWMSIYGWRRRGGGRARLELSFPISPFPFPPFERERRRASPLLI